MYWRRRHENGRGGEVSSKCGVGKENARTVGESLRYGSVLGGRIHAARGLGSENVAGNGCGIDREMGLNFLQSLSPAHRSISRKPIGFKEPFRQRSPRSLKPKMAMWKTFLRPFLNVHKSLLKLTWPLGRIILLPSIFNHDSQSGGPYYD